MTKQAPASDKRKRGRMLRWIGSGIAGGIFLWLLSRQDWPQLFSLLRLMPLWIVPTTLLCFAAGQLCNALRWYILLRARQVAISPFAVIRLIFAGAFASNVLPSTIGGDALRIVGVRRYTGSHSISIGSVLLDRIANLIAMLLVAPFALTIIGPLPITAAGFLPAALKSRLSRLREAVQAWADRPAALLAAVGVSLISVLVIFIGIRLLAGGLGIPVSLAQVIGASVIAYALTSLPISINGLGVREVTTTALYVQLGASLEQAAALALITRLLAMLVTLPGAFWVAASIAAVSHQSPLDEPSPVSHP